MSKKTYEKPSVEKIEFNFTTNIVASSADCTNPDHNWNGNGYGHYDHGNGHGYGHYK